MRVRANTAFYDVQAAVMRTPGDEWTTSAARGGMLSGYGFVSRLDDEQPEQPKPKPRTRRTTRKAAE